MLILVQLWVLLVFVSAEEQSSIFPQIRILPPNITNVDWKWVDEKVDHEFKPQVGDVIYEEIATVPLTSNVSCEQDIDRLIEHIPSIASDFSYETTYANGSKTYTLFEVRTITPCSQEVRKQDKRTRSRKRSVKRFPYEQRPRNPKSNLYFLKSEPFQDLPVFESTIPQHSTAIVSCGPHCRWPCNGILVGPQHVLTSIQCIHRWSPRIIKVGFLGRGESVEWYSVSRFYTPRRGRHLDQGLEYDYALIRLTSSPGRAPLVMRPAPTLTGNDVTFWSFDSQSQMHKSTCTSLSITNGLILKSCNAIGVNTGAGILLSSSGDGYVVIGILSGLDEGTSYRGQERYLATSLTRKKIMQIQNWISKL